MLCKNLCTLYITSVQYVLHRGSNKNDEVHNLFGIFADTNISSIGNLQILSM